MRRKNTTADQLREAASALNKAARAHERELAQLHERILSSGTLFDLETKLASVQRILETTSNLADTSADCRAYTATAIEKLEQLRKEAREKGTRS